MLKPDPKNARKHPKRNQDMIRQSLEEVGAGRGILMDGDGIIRAGNGVYEQAMSLGKTLKIVETTGDELLVSHRTDLHGEEAIRAALWDNRTSETSEWDTEVLQEMFTDGADFSGMWDDDELTKLFTVEAEPEKEEKEAPKERKEPELKEVYDILISCSNEADQVDLLNRFIEEGLQCRALTF